MRRGQALQPGDTPLKTDVDPVQNNRDGPAAVQSHHPGRQAHSSRE